MGLLVFFKTRPLYLGPPAFRNCYWRFCRTRVGTSTLQLFGHSLSLPCRHSPAMLNIDQLDVCNSAGIQKYLLACPLPRRAAYDSRSIVAARCMFLLCIRAFLELSYPPSCKTEANKQRRFPNGSRMKLPPTFGSNFVLELPTDPGPCVSTAKDNLPRIGGHANPP